MTITEQFGSWKSPLTPDSFSKGNCKAICELQATNDGVFWIEQSAVTGKRELYFQGKDDHDRVRWAPERSVQNYVHEYGGGSFMPVEDGVIYTTKEGLYEQSSPDSPPVQLADSEGNTVRFADFSVHSSMVYCVCETHREGQDPDNKLVSIDRTSKSLRSLASGSDFYACPRVSPDGEKIVWMEWNHINMPWDETCIYVAEFRKTGVLKKALEIRSGVEYGINYYNPMWSPDNRLYVIHDSTNFWNLYEIDDKSLWEKNVHPVDIEIGNPLWQFSDRPCAIGEFQIFLRVGEQLMLKSGDSTDMISTPGYKCFSHLSMTGDGTMYTIASGPRKSSSVLKINPDFSVTVIRESRDAAELASFDISEPEKLTFPSDNIPISGYFYPPKNRRYRGLPNTQPPVILLGHGGPTSCALPALDLKKQFFTSRGFAVFDVDYRGSTGYGSEFRNMLKKRWGDVDRDDMINAAHFLIEAGCVDPDKICIMGSSAGGFLVLSALIRSNVFKAAVCIYGVTDLVGLAEETHKFEKGYNESLIGKYPEESILYERKSPIHQMDEIKTAIAFLHGTEDTVVPCSQSIAAYEKLVANGITTAIQLYRDEGHGFRGAEAIRHSTEASYYFFCTILGIKPSIVVNELEIVNLKTSDKTDS